MTADGLAREVRVTESGAEAPGTAIAAATILVICDRLLGEIGRRSHLFGWLRDPGAGPWQWLPVNAYYPANRLVVLCREEPSPHDHLYGELVPAHGLRLLWLDCADLVRDPAGPQAAIERTIAELGEQRRAVAPQPPAERVRESVVARAMASLSQPVKPAPLRPQRLAGSRAAAAERAARFVSERKVLEERSTPARKRPQHRRGPARPTSSGRPASAKRSYPAPVTRPPRALVSAPMDPEPGEQVFFHGHPSWRSIVDFYVKGVLAAVLIGALAGVITVIASGKVEIGWVIAGVLIVFAVMLVAGLIRRIQTTYTITNQRLTINTGILSRELHETRLERVQNVNSRQSVLERLLRVGTVDFDTSAGAEYDFKFRGVAHPHTIVRTVDRAIRELQQQPGPNV